MEVDFYVFLKKKTMVLINSYGIVVNFLRYYQLLFV